MPMLRVGFGEASRVVSAIGKTALASGGAVALVLALSPAIGALRPAAPAKPRVSLDARGGLGSFTPSAADPRLAAMLSRGSLARAGFRFTPASASVRINRSVTVAVRARGDGAALGGDRAALVAAPANAGIAPIAYSLGAAVGWKRFALSGDVAKVDLGALGGREAVDVGLSYNARKWSARVAAGAERPLAGPPHALSGGNPAYSAEIGGSYSIARNVDLTAGVRYRAAERDRLLPLADDRRDSQAVYVGTAFKF